MYQFGNVPHTPIPESIIFVFNCVARCVRLSNRRFEEPCQSRIHRSRWTLVLDIGGLKPSARRANEKRYGFVGCDVSRHDLFRKQLLFEEEFRQALASHGHIPDITTPTRDTDCSLIY